MEVVPVPSVDSIPAHTFASHVSKGDATPLLIRHCAELHSSAALGWTLESLCARVGANQVNVRKIVDPAEYREGRRYSNAQMSFETYCRRILDERPEANGYYLAIQNTARVFPQLVSELPDPFPLVAKKHSGPFMWIAARGHYEFPHFDADDNLLAPIVGRKRVRMWAPQDFKRMYPNRLGSKGRTVQFQVNGDAPDFERHPLARGLRCWEVTVEPGQMLFIPAFTIHQVTSVDACISLNAFFGDDGNNEFLAKLCRPPRLEAFSYWLTNIAAQNREMESWPRILSFLPRSLKGFLRNQFREEASEAQLEQLALVIYKHAGGAVPLAADYHTRRSAPVLKIRGLLFRDVDPSGNDHNRHTKKAKRSNGVQMQPRAQQSEDAEAKRRAVATGGGDDLETNLSVVEKRAETAQIVK